MKHGRVLYQGQTLAVTERADGRYREHGAEYETAVAAYGKEAQACALGSAGNLIGETRALGMEQGRAHGEGNRHGQHGQGQEISQPYPAVGGVGRAAGQKDHAVGDDKGSHHAAAQRGQKRCPQGVLHKR